MSIKARRTKAARNGLEVTQLKVIKLEEKSSLKEKLKVIKA